MRTQSTTTIRLVEKLFQIIEQRKIAEKLEASLKKEIKEVMGTEAILDTGEYCVVREVRNRSDFDKVAFAHDHGQELLNKYMKRSEFEILSVKQAVLQAVK